MERSFQIAIGISVLLFFGTLNIFFRDSVQRGVRDTWSRITGSSVTVAPVPSADAAATPPPKAKTKARIRQRAPEADAELQKKDEAPVAAPKTEVPVPPFPRAADLQAGMTRKEMMSKFGAPSFTASWSEKGTLAEKFIYVRDSQVTAVILRDGQIVTSRTGRHDPWATSSWWQTGIRDKPGPTPAESADRDGPKAH